MYPIWHFYLFTLYSIKALPGQTYTQDVYIICMIDIYELGLLIKDIDNFDMDDFDGRLRFQKTIQLLQSFGIDLGYHYNWYLRGPYCPDLTKDGFRLNSVIQNIPDIHLEFRYAEDHKHYTDFKEFIKDKKDDPDLLEIASSICFLRNEVGANKKDTLRLTEGKMERFTMDVCERTWDELERYGVVKD